MLEQFFGFLGTVFEAAGRAWRLDPTLLGWVIHQPNPSLISVSVAVIAGASVLLGNSAVLFINRVQGVRFWFSLLVNGAALVVLYTIQALFIWVAGLLLVGVGPNLGQVTWAVMLSSAPMFFGVLVLIPFVGPGIARVLQVWSFLALWGVVTVGYGRALWGGLLIAGLGWGGMQLMSWLFAKPVTAVADRLWKAATGRPSMLTGYDVLAGHPFMPVGVDSWPPVRGEAG